MHRPEKTDHPQAALVRSGLFLHAFAETGCEARRTTTKSTIRNYPDRSGKYGLDIS